MKINFRRGENLAARMVLVCYLVLPDLLRYQSIAATPVVAPLGAYSEALQAPARVATDATGNVYVTDSQAGQVVVYDAFGRVSATLTGFSSPLGIAVDANGRIYVAEESLGSVSVYDAQWNPLYKLGAGDQEFSLPNYIATTTGVDGTSVYVSDSSTHQVKVYRDGVLAFRFGAPGTNTAEFNFPTGLFVSTNSEVFVVDQNNDRVQVFNTQGAFLRMFSLVTPLGGMGLGAVGGRSQGIIGDNQGRLYVADSFQGFVRVFNVQGNYLGRVGTMGNLSGQFRTPLGLALDGYNRLFTASANNSRVEVLGMDAYAQLSALPARQLVPAGTNVTFSATISDPSASTFQWYKSTNLLTDGGNVYGANNPTLNLTGVSVSDSGQYSVRIISPGSDISSPAATLSVRVPPAIIAFSPNQTVFRGTSVVFSVVAAGDAPTYQWQFKGYDIPGETRSALVLTNVQYDNSGGYSVSVNNTVGSVMTTQAWLTVIVPPPPPQIDLIALQPGAGMQFVLIGDYGYGFAIDWSTNLLDWMILTNLVNETGSVEFWAPQTTNTLMQVYRSRWMP
jgi:sugar lactone lactonase YvrE